MLCCLSEKRMLGYYAGASLDKDFWIRILRCKDARIGVTSEGCIVLGGNFLAIQSVLYSNGGSFLLLLGGCSPLDQMERLRVYMKGRWDGGGILMRAGG